MSDTYSVTIEYNSGIRKGQTITVDGIDSDDIMSLLGEITQDQLTNAEIMIEADGTSKLYEDYMFDHFTRSQIKPTEKN